MKRKNENLIMKLQRRYFMSRMYINGLLGLPAQTLEEFRIFKRILDKFISNRNGKIKIFEWGSGHSTIYYAKYLKAKGADFQWHSLDNYQPWHQMVKLKIERNNLQSYIQLHLKEFLPFWEKPGWDWKVLPPPCGIFGPKSQDEKAYIQFPQLFNEKFDIVIVDARFRRHCTQVAKEVLSPQGVAILHDAQKAHYHIGLENFRYSKFFDSGYWYPFQKKPNKVWVGSIENTKISELFDKR